MMSAIPESARQTIRHLVLDYGLIGVTNVVAEVCDAMARDMEETGSLGVVQAHKYRMFAGALTAASVRLNEKAGGD